MDESIDEREEVMDATDAVDDDLDADVMDDAIDFEMDDAIDDDTDDAIDDETDDTTDLSEGLAEPPDRENKPE